MGGGLIQLMAIGPQNNKMCGNPKVSFFKAVYSQYCNFGIEWFYQYFEGEKKLGKTVKCVLDKKGDLIREMYVVFEISTDSDEVPKLGLRLIDYVEIQIGGQTIDKHYGEWLDIWTQLNYTHGKYEVFKSLIKDKYSNSTQTSSITTGNCSESFKRLYVPLVFWFNLNPGLALPLVSLQYHEVTLYLKIKALEDLQIYTTKTETTKDPLAANASNKIFTSGVNGIGHAIANPGSTLGDQNVIPFMDLTRLPSLGLTQLGLDIDGEAPGDNSGRSVSLSSDGHTVAIGSASVNESSGHVRIFKYNGTSWTQAGPDIDGKATGDWSGLSVSLSSNGNIVAIGAPANESGYVRIYQYNGSSWTLLGDITGEIVGGWSGWSVSLSSDGHTVAIGAYSSDKSLPNEGHVSIYRYNNAPWIKLGKDIDGKVTNKYSGRSVS